MRKCICSTFEFELITVIRRGLGPPRHRLSMRREHAFKNVIRNCDLSVRVKTSDGVPLPTHLYLGFNSLFDTLELFVRWPCYLTSRKNLKRYDGCYVYGRVNIFDPKEFSAAGIKRKINLIIPKVSGIVCTRPILKYESRIGHPEYESSCDKCSELR